MMTSPIYRYGLLLPSAAEGAEAHNRPLLGPDTLGIEVTEPDLAARCGLGNIDPQHGKGARPDAPAAIEACLDAEPPPRGARLVTLRPDCDALGAMALLSLKAKGLRFDRMTEEQLRRVLDIAEADKFASRSWSGPRPLPATTEEMLRAFGDGDLTALAAACADETLSLDERVTIAREWLLDGRVPKAYLAAPRQRADMMADALRGGRIALGTAAGGRLALVTSDVVGALRLGYLLAPVVVACNPAHPFRTAGGAPRPGRKYTIAQWGAGHADLDTAAGALGRLEPGWGGSPTIKGSPQGAPSRLALDTVLAVVERALTRDSSTSDQVAEPKV